MQDIEPVIKTLTTLDPAVEATAYNFFTPQPVKGEQPPSVTHNDGPIWTSVRYCEPPPTLLTIKTGARVYFFHHILHDWPDKECVSILENVIKAMVPGYSKLLIHELIVPETNADTLYCTVSTNRNPVWTTLRSPFLLSCSRMCALSASPPSPLKFSERINLAAMAGLSNS